jgi:hypothetical protein
MFGLFGKKGGGDKAKKKEENKDKVLETINKLNGEVDHLEEKIKHLEAKKNGQTALAKEKLQKGDKNGAKQCLQKKKWFDDQIKTLDGAMMMLEEQKMMLDGTMSMGTVYDALKQGSDAINLASDNFKVEDLDKIRDEMEDNKMAFEEKNEFFKEYSVKDDPELDDELDQLANELEEEALPDVKQKHKEVIIEADVTEKNKNDEVNNLEAFLDM